MSSPKHPIILAEYSFVTKLMLHPAQHSIFAFSFSTFCSTLRLCLFLEPGWFLRINGWPKAYFFSCLLNFTYNYHIIIFQFITLSILYLSLVLLILSVFQISQPLMFFNGYENPKLAAIRLLRSQGCCGSTEPQNQVVEEVMSGEL